MAFAEQSSRSRLPTIAAVALIHAGIGYAFISGLAMTVIHETFPTFEVTSIPDTPPPPDIAPPPPQPAQAETMASPKSLVVTLAPVPDVAVVQLPSIPRSIAPAAEPEVIVPSVPVLPPTPPALASGARARGDKGSWITADDYPPAALRAEEEGSVSISVAIDARGRVSGCQVTGSSGHPALDDATCRLYARRARFAPALDDAGQPVATTLSDRIRWQIPRR